VSGTKFYEQAEHDYTAVGFTDVSTYQTIDIEVGETHRLTYCAIDAEGNIRDAFVMTKPRETTDVGSQ